MFFQPLSAENGTFFQSEVVEFIYKIPAFKETLKQQLNSILICIVLEKQTELTRRYNYDRKSICIQSFCSTAKKRTLNLIFKQKKN